MVCERTKMRLLATAVLLSGLFASMSNAQTARRMEVFDLRFLDHDWSKGGDYGPCPAFPSIRGCWLWTGWETDRPAVAFSGEDYDDGIIPIERGDDSGHGTPWLSRGHLAEAVRRFIAEDSWSNQRNQLEVRGSRLVVVNTPDVIERVQRFLLDLEARRRRLVSIELAVVPAAVLDKAAKGWNRPGATPWWDAALFEKLVLLAGDKGSLLAGLIIEGDRAILRPEGFRTHVVDYEVNQTGVIPVSNPVVDWSVQGASAEAVVLPAPSGDWFLVQVGLRKGTARKDTEKRRVDDGELELVTAVQHGLSTYVVAPAGKTVLAGCFSAPPVEGKKEPWKRPESFVGLLRVRRIRGRADEGTKNDDLPHVLDVGLLLEPLADQGHGILFDEMEPSVGYDVEDLSDAAKSGLVRPERLEKVVRSVLPPEKNGATDFWRTGGTLFVRASDEAATKVKDRVEALARERARMLQVDLRQVSLSEKEVVTLGGAGSLLAPNWFDKLADKPAVHLRLFGLSGIRNALGAVAGRTYVSDIEYVSGGTGQVIIEVGDIVVKQVGGGVVVNVTASRVPSTSWIQLRLRGEIARPPEFARKTRVRTDQGVTQQTVKDGEARPVEPTGRWIEIDLPDEDTDRWEHLVTIPLGRSMMLSALPDSEQPGRTRVLIATVTDVSLPRHGQ